MNIDLKNNKKNKYLVYAICIPITIMLLYSSLGDLLGEGDDDIVVNPQGTENTAVNVASAPANANSTQAPVQSTSNSLATDGSASIIFGENSSNPFVEVGELIVDKADPQQPVMMAKPVPSQVPAASLPAIPAPSLPSIPTPPSPSNFANPSVAPAPQKPVAVQGILSSGDGAMAIMSDGTILSEGDVYNDGRIAWIGGEGIHFDDGTSILYK